MMSIHDPLTYREYTDRTPSTVKKYGGKFLTRGEPVVRLCSNLRGIALDCARLPGETGVGVAADRTVCDECAAGFNRRVSK